MLKRFEVQGYRNFKNNFILDLSNTRDYKFNQECVKDGIVKTGIIYGQNAVGKTNFGNALLDIKNNILPKEYSDLKEPNYLNADLIDGRVIFKYEFVFDNTEVFYKYEKNRYGLLMYELLAVDDNVIIEFDHNNKKIIQNGLSYVHADSLNWEFADLEKSVLAYVVNNTTLTADHILKKLFRFIRNMFIVYGNKSSNHSFFIDIVVKKIIDNDLVNDLERFLNEFGIQEKLVVKTTPTGEKNLYFKHERLIPFLENYSSGTGALLGIYNCYQYLVKQESVFYYLDEFDAFYHYELSENMVEKLKKTTNCQVIMSSHNTDLLTNKLMRPDCLFVLTKEKISSIADATSRELREGHNLEKLYKSGEFNE